MVLLIIIPIKWLFHWEYTLFSDKPILLFQHLCISVPFSHGMFINPLGEDSQHGNGQVHLVRRQGFHL